MTFIQHTNKTCKFLKQWLRCAEVFANKIADSLSSVILLLETLILQLPKLCLYVDNGVLKEMYKLKNSVMIPE